MTILLSLLFFLIKTTICVVALTVLLSYTVAWYERANSSPALIDRRFTTRGIGIAFWLLIQETGCLLLTILLRPLGWQQPRIPDSKDSENPPVILLHGLFQNRSCLLWLQHRLKEAGYQQVISINTPPWRDIEALSEQLAKKVDELRIHLKVEKVILIGHSMGGLIARNYVQSRGGSAHVQAMVTLGSPHHGSSHCPRQRLRLQFLPATTILSSPWNQPKWRVPVILNSMAWGIPPCSSTPVRYKRLSKL